MWRRDASSVVEVNGSAKMDYDEHIRACDQCFRATTRGDLCALGLIAFDGIPEAPAVSSTPTGLGSYGPEGLDDSMTFAFSG